MVANDRPLTVAMMLESHGPGGAENVLFDLAEAIRQRGHIVHPIVTQSDKGWLGEKLRASGFETLTFDLRGMLDWRSVRYLGGLIRELGIDLVHGHEFDGAVYGAAAARFTGRANVITMHGNQTMTAAWRRRAALRWAFRSSQFVVAVSVDTQGQLNADLGLRQGVVGVIRNGIPLRAGRAEAVRRELGSKEGEILILAVGNMIARKGHIFLLRALRRLEETGLSVPWRLAIAGGWGGEEQPRLAAFATEAGIADRVHLLTHRTDVPDLLSAADVFVMPSLWEGLPLAVLEAMLSGVPVVASKVSGIPEAIVTEEHGLLVSPADVDSLAGALGRLLRDPALRDRLATGARARAIEEFTIDVMADAYERLYRSAHAQFAGGRSS